ncbi:MAG: glycosyltransferase family 2 protein [Deltaproteobacteria bacterium]|nr:glycosyltransferase family 2 protein [Deltaproteobacteria bacterium]
MLKTTVVIPTYNRTSELAACIQSIINQTIKPHEIIVVDDGLCVPPELEKQCADADISYIYIKKQGNPGLTASRNLSIGYATGDIIFFFDDDVVLQPDYIREILKIYEADAPCAIGGVGGFIENRPVLDLKDHIRRFFERIFLITGKEEGKVLSSGFCIDYGDTANPLLKPQAVDFLAGCAMSFRKKVFDELLFDVQISTYSGEDKDFSYRVAKRYGLIIAPAARLLHLESPKMRPDRIKQGRNYVVFVRRFFKDYIKEGMFLREVFFWYALAGHILLGAATAMLPPRRAKINRLAGLLLGVKDILLRRA